MAKKRRVVKMKKNIFTKMLCGGLMLLLGNNVWAARFYSPTTSEPMDCRLCLDPETKVIGNWDYPKVAKFCLFQSGFCGRSDTLKEKKELAQEASKELILMGHITKKQLNQFIKTLKPTLMDKVINRIVKDVKEGKRYYDMIGWHATNPGSFARDYFGPPGIIKIIKEAGYQISELRDWDIGEEDQEVQNKAIKQMQAEMGQ